MDLQLVIDALRDIVVSIVEFIPNLVNGLIILIGVLTPTPWSARVMPVRSIRASNCRRRSTVPSSQRTARATR